MDPVAIRGPNEYPMDKQTRASKSKSEKRTGSRIAATETQIFLPSQNPGGVARRLPLVSVNLAVLTRLNGFTSLERAVTGLY